MNRYGVGVWWYNGSAWEWQADHARINAFWTYAEAEYYAAELRRTGIRNHWPGGWYYLRVYRADPVGSGWQYVTRSDEMFYEAL